MRAGRLAMMLGAVDPDLEVMFEVDDVEPGVAHDAEFRFVKSGERYVLVNVEIEAGPGHYRAVDVPFSAIVVDDGDSDA